MTAFEVFVNGEHVCTAGTKRVLTATLTWAWHEEAETRLHVGGISEPAKDAPQHVVWDIPALLKIGDEVTIRIVSTDSVDRPLRS